MHIPFIAETNSVEGNFNTLNIQQLKYKYLQLKEWMISKNMHATLQRATRTVKNRS